MAPPPDGDAYSGRQLPGEGLATATTAVDTDQVQQMVEQMKLQLMQSFDEELNKHKATIEARYEAKLAEQEALLRKLESKADAKDQELAEPPKRYQLVDLQGNVLPGVYTSVDHTSDGQVVLSGGAKGFANAKGRTVYSELTRGSVLPEGRGTVGDDSGSISEFSSRRIHMSGALKDLWHKRLVVNSLKEAVEFREEFERTIGLQELTGDELSDREQWKLIKLLTKTGSTASTWISKKFLSIEQAHLHSKTPLMELFWQAYQGHFEADTDVDALNKWQVAKQGIGLPKEKVPLDETPDMFASRLETIYRNCSRYREEDLVVKYMDGLLPEVRQVVKGQFMTSGKRDFDTICGLAHNYHAANASMLAAKHQVVQMRTRAEVLVAYVKAGLNMEPRDLKDLGFDARMKASQTVQMVSHLSTADKELLTGHGFIAAERESKADGGVPRGAPVSWALPAKKHNGGKNQRQVNNASASGSTDPTRKPSKKEFHEKGKATETPREPCKHCGKNNHASDRCWQEFPHLKKQSRRALVAQVADLQEQLDKARAERGANMLHAGGSTSKQVTFAPEVDGGEEYDSDDLGALGFVDKQCGAYVITRSGTDGADLPPVYSRMHSQQIMPVSGVQLHKGMPVFQVGENAPAVGQEAAKQVTAAKEPQQGLFAKLKAELQKAQPNLLGVLRMVTEAMEAGGGDTNQPEAGANTIRTVPGAFDRPIVKYAANDEVKKYLEQEGVMHVYEKQGPAPGLSLLAEQADGTEKQYDAVRVLLDSGADLNMLKRSVVQLLAVETAQSSVRVKNVHGGTREGNVETGYLKVYVNKGTEEEFVVESKFIVGKDEEMSHDMLLGAGFLYQLGGMVNPVTRCLEYLPGLLEGDFQSKAQLPVRVTRTQHAYHTRVIGVVETEPPESEIRDICVATVEPAAAPESAGPVVLAAAVADLEAADVIELLPGELANGVNELLELQLRQDGALDFRTVNAALVLDEQSDFSDCVEVTDEELEDAVLEWVTPEKFCELPQEFLNAFSECQLDISAVYGSPCWSAPVPTGGGVHEVVLTMMLWMEEHKGMLKTSGLDPAAVMRFIRDNTLVKGKHMDLVWNELNRQAVRAYRSTVRWQTAYFYLERCASHLLDEATHIMNYERQEREQRDRDAMLRKYAAPVQHAIGVVTAPLQQLQAAAEMREPPVGSPAEYQAVKKRVAHRTTRNKTNAEKHAAGKVPRMSGEARNPHKRAKPRTTAEKWWSTAMRCVSVMIVLGATCMVGLLGGVSMGPKVWEAEQAIQNAGTWRHALMLQTDNPDRAPTAAELIDSTLPDGYKHLSEPPMYDKDPEGGWLFGRHPDVTPEQSAQLKGVVQSRKHCFAYSVADMPGYNGPEGPFRIQLKTDKPIKVRMRRRSPLEKHIMTEKCDQLKGNTIIEPATGEKYVLETVLAAKKDPDGNWTDTRFCTDFRPVNEETLADEYRVEHPDDIMDAVGNHKFFTKIDMRSGFHQIPIAEEDKDKTTFYWNNECWRYTRMPFGCRNATAKFQRVMDTEITKCCKCFVDDVLIHSATFEEHLDHVTAFLDAIHEVGMRAHPDKSMFGTHVVEYLGHNVSAYGMQPNEAKVLSIKKLQAPRNKSELRSVLGFLNYYRCYVVNFSARVVPLTALLADSAKFEWGDAQQAAFDDVREEMCREGKALRRVDFDKPLLVYTDWSNLGIGCVLAQQDECGKDYVCCAISRSLNKHEKNYSSYEGEMLAAVWGIKSLRHYLHGVPFTLITDHQPLHWLMRTQDLKGKHARWALCLQDYDFTIQYRPGVKHENVDVLSRFPAAETADETGARLDGDREWARPDPAEQPTARTVSCAMARTAYAIVEQPDATVMLAAQLQSPVAPAMDQFAPKSYDLLLGYNGSVLEKGITELYEDELRTDAELHQQAVLAKRAAKWVAAAGPVVETEPDTPLKRVRKGKSYQSIDTHSVAADFFTAAAQAGIVFFEPFGGMCSGLEMVLRNGVTVRHYLYADIDNNAQRIASHRVELLHQRYPHLLPREAIAHMLRLPQDVAAITSTDLQSTVNAYQHLPWLIVAGWECQDLSPAGSGRGLEGSRSRTFYPLLSLVGTMQAMLPNTPVAYILENTYMSHQHTAAHVKHVSLSQLEAALGPYLVFDAARFGSYAHRVRQYWTNLGPSRQLQHVINTVKRPAGRLVTDVLDKGAAPAPVTYPDQLPFYACNVVGQPRRALPTLVARKGSYAFVGNRGGVVTDADGNREPNVAERERAMGYSGQCTAAPGVDEAARFAAIGRAMDAYAMENLFAIAAALHYGTPRAVMHATSWKLGGVSKEAFSQSRAGSEQLPPGRHALLALIADQDEVVVANLESGRRLDDVWHDNATLQYLRKGVHESGVSRKEQRRVQKRAEKYYFKGETLYRRFAGARHVPVPKPELRAGIVEKTHNRTGHYGRHRTTELVAHSYWWAGMNKTVAEVISKCKHCDMVNTNFANETVELQPLTIEPMFYRWACDLAGPFTVTKAGNKYVMVLVEYFTKQIHLAPLPSKESYHTKLAFLRHVVAQYGAPAECVTDQGREWQGQFHEMLVDCFIDHRLTSPNHPQADGLAERAVQTMKCALKKTCSETGKTSDWEEKLPYIELGYRCSKQSSTGFSPYELLYAVKPRLPAEIARDFDGEIKFPGQGAGTAAIEAAGAMIAQRGKIIKKKVPIALENLKIAQHRDTKRYAVLRSGAYHPKLMRFEPGDFVYVRQLQPGSALHTQVTQHVLRVKGLKPGNQLILQGKCGSTITVHRKHCAPCHLPDIDPTVDTSLAVPHQDLPCQACKSAGDEASMLLCDSCNGGYHLECLNPPLTEVPTGNWQCPSCVAAGVELKETEQVVWSEGMNPLMSPLPTHIYRGKRLVPLASRTRLADAEAKALHGRVIRKLFDELELYGQVEFLGPHERPYYFRIEYTDGDQETMTLKELQQYLMPAGTPLRHANSAQNAAPLTSLQDLPADLQLTTKQGMRKALDMLMPGNWHEAHVTRLTKLVPGGERHLQSANGHTPGEPECVVTTPEEISVLLDNIDWTRCNSVLDPCCGTKAISNTIAARNTHLAVHTADVNPVHMPDVLLDIFKVECLKGLNSTGYEVIATSPPFALLDLVLPLLVLAAPYAVFAHVPGHYLTNAMPQRGEWLARLAEQGRLIVLGGLPVGPCGRRCVWLLIFRDAKTRKQLYKPSGRATVQYTL